MSTEVLGFIPESERSPQRSRVSETALARGVDLGEYAHAGYETGIELSPGTRAQLQLGSEVWLSVAPLEAGAGPVPLSALNAERAQTEAGALLFASSNPHTNQAEGFRDVFIPRGESVTVGRQTMRLPRTVSRQHVEIGVTDDNRLWMRDLDSANGTKVHSYHS